MTKNKTTIKKFVGIKIISYLYNMKNIYIIVVTILSLTVKSQVIDYQNFKTELFNKILFNKVNDYRKKKGLEMFKYSKQSELLISKVNVTKMVKENKFYHPKVNILDTVLKGKIINEYLKNEKRQSKIKSQYVGVDYGEIIYCTNSSYKTYDELAQSCLDGWLNSPKHKEILDFNFYTNKNLVSSCYILKKSENQFFCTFNMLSLGVY